MGNVNQRGKNMSRQTTKKKQIVFGFRIIYYLILLYLINIMILYYYVHWGTVFMYPK
jgi:hypothetical protein